jgi:peptidoglycan/xylan/chitin deacetylase (PgdA/CDA1 family)
MQKKAIGLLLAAAAAYGYYRYSKMTPDQKKRMMQKGKDLLKDNFGGLADYFGTKKPAAAKAGNM